MLTTAGHVLREPANALVVSLFNELFNFKSLRLVVICLASLRYSSHHMCADLASSSVASRRSSANPGRIMVQ